MAPSWLSSGEQRSWYLSADDADDTCSCRQQRRHLNPPEAGADPRFLEAQMWRELSDPGQRREHSSRCFAG